MAELRRLFTGMGFAKVASYIQSGNVALDSLTEPAPADLAATITDAFGFEVPVVVVAQSELSEILAQSPFVSNNTEPKLVHVVFLSGKPEADAVARLHEDAYHPDRFVIAGRAAHVWYPNGSARSKLTVDVFERSLGLTATGRNLVTVRRLSEL